MNYYKQFPLKGYLVSLVFRDSLELLSFKELFGVIFLMTYKELQYQVIKIMMCYHLLHEIGVMFLIKYL